MVLHHNSVIFEHYRWFVWKRVFIMEQQLSQCYNIDGSKSYFTSQQHPLFHVEFSTEILAHRN